MPVVEDRTPSLQAFTAPSGRLGFDPGTLGVFPDGPCRSVTVQICCLDEIDDPSMYSEMLSTLNSWLDRWLDQNKFVGTVDITFAQ
jgi:hypothetical protein